MPSRDYLYVLDVEAFSVAPQLVQLSRFRAFMVDMSNSCYSKHWIKLLERPFDLMRARSLFIGIIFVLFMSGWGRVLAAALCPHTAQDHSCCHALMAGSGSHEAMGDMQMMPAAPSPKTNTGALGRPVEACAHCIGHSGLPATPVATREANQARRIPDVNAPLALMPLAPSAPSFIPAISARQGSPPGVSVSRHVLIGVFRI